MNVLELLIYGWLVLFDFLAICLSTLRLEYFLACLDLGQHFLRVYVSHEI